MFRLKQNDLAAFLSSLCTGRTVYALAQDDTQYHLIRARDWDPQAHTLGDYRPVEPLKSLFLPPREMVGTPGAPFSMPELKERIVIGAKGCDVASLRVHDYVFLDTEPIDPFYAMAREKTLIVSCDCTDACESCFCTAVDEQPYPLGGFDINLSPLGDDFAVESGSTQGQRLLEAMQDLLAPGDDALAATRDSRRDTMTRQVTEQATARSLPPGCDLQTAICKSENAKLWDEFAADCVECGACNFVCCTCHCFLLADGKTPTGFPARTRKWDSCLYRNFARVAGDANPRKHRADRLYNRFDKKFNFFPQVLGIYACDGCGRCTEACTGKIDIRDVLRRAINEH